MNPERIAVGQRSYRMVVALMLVWWFLECPIAHSVKSRFSTQTFVTISAQISKCVPADSPNQRSADLRKPKLSNGKIAESRYDYLRHADVYSPFWSVRKADLTYRQSNRTRTADLSYDTVRQHVSPCHNSVCFTAKTTKPSFAQIKSTLVVNLDSYTHNSPSGAS